MSVTKKVIKQMKMEDFQVIPFQGTYFCILLLRNAKLRLTLAAVWCSSPC